LTGLQTVRQALIQRRRPLYRLWLSGRTGAGELRRQARDLGVEVRTAANGELGRISGSGKHQGVVLECGPLPVHTLEELLRFQPPGGTDLVVLLTGVEDPRNIGAVARSCSWLGARALLLTGRATAPLSPSASRTSAGALESLPVARVSSAAHACRSLITAGYDLVAVELGGIPLEDWEDVRPKTALVLGGEDRGVGQAVRDLCRNVVSVAGSGPVGSLNVSVAAGIAIHHVVTGRRGRG
ncbi:RNA methyltransferase, partial [bacterium]